MAGTLVAEALAKGDMGLAVAALAPGSVATALVAVGHRRAAGTYLPEFTGDDVPAAALALTEPAVLFDVLCPTTTAVRARRRLRPQRRQDPGPARRRRRAVRRRRELDGQPVLFLVESGTDGLAVEGDPAMGVRAASLTRLTLTDVTVADGAVLGETDGTTYAECVRLSPPRLVRPRGRHRPGRARLRHALRQGARGVRRADRPPAVGGVHGRQHRDRAAGDAAGHLQGRLARRAGKDFAREVALARKLCADKGMQIGLDGVQLLGGHGFVKEHPVERWYRDLRAIGVMEGGVLV